MTKNEVNEKAVRQRKESRNKPATPLKDLNLLNRFLFAEAMEDPENVTALLEIILGKDMTLSVPPQTEKERRTTPENRSIRMDVMAEDEGGALYEAEAQNEHTNNLSCRSRFYQGLIDCKLLQPGEIDFNQINELYIIIIAPFDIFGEGKYMYTFRMKCEESADLHLNDKATRIFLNTHGKNPQEVSPELVELLRYMERTTEETASQCESERIRQMHQRIRAIKESEEVGVRYMQAWEEKIMDRNEGREEGRAEGRKEGLIKGREEERVNTERERSRADKAENRADEAEKLIAQLRAEIEELRKRA